ncbi:hypothetical protein NOS3756_57920 (plasmid) [Nostoc sp. NIES-3756]|nr:hypothetical protein NOS3756_57920 [Nostoc sp. NIES-3756]BAY41545.1 hypothetical protein NIES2111_59410 [Nostoc sp. NIES-2111]
MREHQKQDYLRLNRSGDAEVVVFSPDVTLQGS